MLTLTLVFISMVCSTFAAVVHATILQEGKLRTVAKYVGILSSSASIACVVLMAILLIQGG
jgi:hypothetical protein